MSLSNYPTHKLIHDVKIYAISPLFRDDDIVSDIDQELDLRQPDIAAWYFGDCDGQPVFIPIEPECDGEGKPIVSEAIGYSEGEEIWG